MMKRNSKEYLLQEIENLSRSQKITQSAFKNLRSTFNDYMNNLWTKNVTDKCLNIGVREDAFVYDLYWVGHPEAHTMNAKEKAVTLLIKNNPEHQYVHLAKDALAIISSEKPLLAEVNAFKDLIGQRGTKATPTPEELRPAFSQKVINELTARLQETCAPAHAEIKQSVMRYYNTVIDKFDSLSESDKIRGPYHVYAKDPYVRQIILMTFDTISFQKTPYTKKDDADQIVDKIATDHADKAVKDYISKQISKIGAIIDAIGYPSKMEVYTDAKSFKLSGCVYFEFPDNRSFRLISKIESAFSSHGNFFYRFPSRFHDIHDKNGECIASMMSEREMWEWAGIKNQSNDLTA